MKLFAARYNTVNYGAVLPAESFSHIADVNIRWSIPYGLKRMEVSVFPKSVYDQFSRYESHLGQVLALYDDTVFHNIAGQIFAVAVNGPVVTYICAGAGQRINDDLYGISDYTGTSGSNTDVVIKDILTDSVAISSSDYSNIDSTGIVPGGWVPRRLDNNGDMNAGDAITELIALGDSQDRVADFYFVSPPFDGVNIGLPIPYLKMRNDAANPDWRFSRHDLVQGGDRLERHIWDLRRNIWTGFTNLVGTADASQADLYDASADFLDSLVSVGDKVYNFSQNKLFTVEGITNSTTMKMNDENSGNWVSGNTYVIIRSKTDWTQSGPSTETDLWAPIHAERRPNLNQAGAQEYGDNMLAIYEKPLQQQAFTLGAPYITSYDGTQSPLWRPLFHDSFYFQITDLYPSGLMFGNNNDRLQSFMAVAMDYTYKSNRLRIVPATKDKRLDVLLAQALGTTWRLDEIERIQELASAE